MAAILLHKREADLKEEKERMIKNLQQVQALVVRQQRQISLVQTRKDQHINPSKTPRQTQRRRSSMLSSADARHTTRRISTDSFSDMSKDNDLAELQKALLFDSTSPSSVNKQSSLFSQKEKPPIASVSKLFASNSESY